jgi:hypothetical protein
MYHYNKRLKLHTEVYNTYGQAFDRLDALVSNSIVEIGNITKVIGTIGMYSIEYVR